jgi:hypothetical protein
VLNSEPHECDALHLFCEAGDCSQVCRIASDLTQPPQISPLYTPSDVTNLFVTLRICGIIQANHFTAMNIVSMFCIHSILSSIMFKNVSHNPLSLVPVFPYTCISTCTSTTCVIYISSITEFSDCTTPFVYPSTNPPASPISARSPLSILLKAIST